MAHPGGRPRTTTPETADLIELGNELVHWATRPLSEDEVPASRCRFSQWYGLIKNIRHKDWDLMVEKKEFQSYYERAQIALAERFINAGNKDQIKESIANRFLRIYAPEVKKEENEKIKYEAEIKKKLDDESSQKIIIEKDQQLVELTQRLMDAEDLINDLQKNLGSQSHKTSLEASL